VVVSWQVRSCVVAHHEIDVGRFRTRLGVVRYKAGHPIGDLIGGAGAAVTRVLGFGQRGALKVADPVLLALIRVRHRGLQTVNVGSAGLETEIPEHVVERAVLEHQDDDVVDLFEVCDRVVCGWRYVRLPLRRRTAGGRGRFSA
jgi:hypothetical protein